MTTRRVRRGEKADEDKARRQRLDDPEVQARLREIHETIESNDPLSPGIDAEGLSGFLNEREGKKLPFVVFTPALGSR